MARQNRYSVWDSREYLVKEHQEAQHDGRMETTSVINRDSTKKT